MDATGIGYTHQNLRRSQTLVYRFISEIRAVDPMTVDTYCGGRVIFRAPVFVLNIRAVGLGSKVLFQSLVQDFGVLHFRVSALGLEPAIWNIQRSVSEPERVQSSEKPMPVEYLYRPGPRVLPPRMPACNST